MIPAKPHIFLIAFAGAGGWWYFVGGRALSEADVREFYVRQERATLERSPDRLCAPLEEHFVATRTGRPDASPHDRQQQCSDYRGMFAAFEQIGDRMGGESQLDYSYEIKTVKICADHESAAVDASYSLDVAGSIMNIRSRSTDGCIRRCGTTLMVRGDGDTGLASAVGSGR